MLLLRSMMSEVEVATDTDTVTSEAQPPSNKMKAEQSSSETEFLADLFRTSVTSADHDKLDNYVSSTDGGPGVLSFRRGKEDMRPKWSICVNTSNKHFF